MMHQSRPAAEPVGHAANSFCPVPDISAESLEPAECAAHTVPEFASGSGSVDSLQSGTEVEACLPVTCKDLPDVKGLAVDSAGSPESKPASPPVADLPPAECVNSTVFAQPAPHVGGLSDPSVEPPGQTVQACPGQSAASLAGFPSVTPPKVPGSLASPVDSAGLWHEALECLLKCGGHLFHFLRSLLEASDRPPSAKRFWPLPIASSCASKPRNLDALRAKAPSDVAATLMSAALSWLHAGSPPCNARTALSSLRLQGASGTECPSDLSSQEVHALRERIWEGLVSKAQVWCAFGVVDAEAMGRTASKVEATEGWLQSLEAQVGRLGVGGSDPTGRAASYGKSKAAPLCAAKDIEPERLKFGPPPKFCPRRFLDPLTRSIYDRPIDNSSYRPGMQAAGVPKVRVRVAGGCKLALLEKLDSVGRLALIPAWKAPAGFGAGAFAVPKSLAVDRFILDGRPFNSLEVPSNRWLGTLCSAAALANITLEPGEMMVASGEDIRDFFYSFVIGPQRLCRNTFNFTVELHQVAHLSCFSDSLRFERLLAPALSTMAMGDCQAVAVGQTAHLGVLLQSGCLDLSQTLLQHAPVPRDPCLFGLVLDDLVVLERLALSEYTSASFANARSPAIMRDIRKAYSEASLPRHPDKGFELEPKADFWGVTLDGIRGTVTPSGSRAAPLASLTLKVVNLGVATIGLLQALAGGWVSIMLLSRRTLSILDRVYAVQEGRDQRDIVRLSPSLAEELLLCVVLAPLMQSDLRLAHDDQVQATDASNWGEAGVSARLGVKAVKELCRHNCSKGAWTRLLPRSLAWLRERHLCPIDEELPGEQNVYKASPLFTEVARSLDFELDFSSPAPKLRHINEGELRGVLLGEARRAYRRPFCKFLTLCDSQVACGCLAKGRSSSATLRKQLLQSLGVQLSLGVLSIVAYIASEDNPADDPTRGKKIRAPSKAIPPWLKSAEDGSYSDLDAALRAWKATPHDVSGLPDPEELLGYDVPCAADLSTNRADSVPPAVSSLHPASLTSLFNRPTSHLPSLPASGPLPVCESSAGDSRAALPPSSDPVPPGFDWPTARARATELLSNVPRSQFLLHPCFKGSFLSALRFVGCLDLYSGRRGVAKALVKQGLPWVLCYDWEHDPAENLLDSHVQSSILALIEAGAFNSVGLAPLCTSFSTAVTPPIRSKEFLEGVPWATANQRLSLETGNEHCAFCAKVLRRALLHNCAVWMENPDNSWLWEAKTIRSFW